MGTGSKNHGDWATATKPESFRSPLPGINPNVSDHYQELKRATEKQRGLLLRCLCCLLFDFNNSNLTATQILIAPRLTLLRSRYWHRPRACRRRVRGVFVPCAFG